MEYWLSDKGIRFSKNTFLKAETLIILIYINCQTKRNIGRPGH
jgi:hypothetical protein